MKIFKVAIGCIAIMTTALSKSFSVTNNDGKTGNAVNDCWSSFQRHQAGLPPDVSSDDCGILTSGCCVKPDPNNPGQYLLFAEN